MQSVFVSFEGFWRNKALRHWKYFISLGIENIVTYRLNAPFQLFSFHFNKLRMFENEVKRFFWIFDALIGRKLCNGRVYNLCSSSDIISMIKSRRIRLAVHVSFVGEIEIMYKQLIICMKKLDSLGGLDISWRTVVSNKLYTVQCAIFDRHLKIVIYFFQS
jgi:hypothetical protein